MRILLDTHIAIWEITIKHMNHPETFLYSGKHLAEGCEANGFISLPIFNKHTAELETLVRSKDAPPHKDPFDRMLLAQAKSERMKFMTHDSLISYYNESFIIGV